MRKTFWILCGIFLAYSAYAIDVSMKTLIVNGKPGYTLRIGNFGTEKEAKAFESTHPEDIINPHHVEHDEENNTYYVLLGPSSDYNAIKNVQAHLQESVNTIPATSDTTSNTLETPTPQAKKLWNLTNAEVRSVIEEVSRITGKNFIIDPRVQGKISMVSSTPISDAELYPMFLSMLQISGYAAVPSENAIKIVPNNDAKVASSSEEDIGKANGDEIMVATIPVHYVPAEQLVPILRPLMPQWSSVSAYAPSNMLILSGRADNIKQLMSIIEQVDTSSSSAIDVVHLQYALAMDVANTLKELTKSQNLISSHNSTTIAVDDRSNAILLRGPKTDRLKLRLIINKLDKPRFNGGDSNTQVVYLHYLRAEDLVPILAGIAQANFSGNIGTTIGTITRPALDSTNPASNMVNLNPMQSNTQAAQNVGPSTSPSTTPGANTNASNNQNEGSTKPTVQIIGEPNTNSIIINAPASVIRILKAVIKQLDIRPAQLLVEALVTEVDEREINNLGIEWGSLGQAKDPTHFRPGFAILNSKTSINDFQAQLYALTQSRKANILSTPSVVVLDNRQAKILVGKQVSVAATSYPNNATGTTTASPYTTFDRVNVALHLYVRPQITQGSGIQLQIDQGNDTLDPATENNVEAPVFRISSIVTSVHVQSGDIIVLGGLTQDSLGNDDTRIPILSDIPGLGRIFQRNLTNREKRVLMVFIRPIILHNQHDASQFTNEKYNNLRDYQLKWIRGQEEYDPRNKAIVLPALKTAKLPTPFTQQARLDQK
jgi:general secretion pathway protein D